MGAAKAERVDYLTELMARGEYRSGVTPLELSRRWGISMGEVTKDAAEASRRLRADKEHLDVLRQAHLLLLEAVLHDARTMRSKLTNTPDWKHVLEAWRMLAEYQLDWNPSRDTKDTGPKPEDMGDDELRELASKAFGVLSKQLKSEAIVPGRDKPEGPEQGDRSGTQGSES
jgi:hypothetical protein